MGLLVQTTGKRLGQIVRFELEAPESPGAAPAQLGHLTEEEEKSHRGSDAEVRQKARQALESLLEGNARFRKVSICLCKAWQIILSSLKLRADCGRQCPWLEGHTICVCLARLLTFVSYVCDRVNS